MSRAASEMRLNKWAAVLDSDGGGFVDPLPEFTPEAVEHQLGGSLATGIFGNTGNVQSDALPFLVTKNVL